MVIALGAHHDRQNETNLPKIIERLHPKLILKNPLKELGDPSESKEKLIANENYWMEIEELFKLWDDSMPKDLCVG